MVLPRAECPACHKTMGIRVTPSGGVYPRHVRSVTLSAEGYPIGSYCPMSRCVVQPGEYEDPDEAVTVN